MMTTISSPFKVFYGAEAWCPIDRSLVPRVNVAAVGGVPPLVGDDLSKEAPATRAVVRGEPREVVLLDTLVWNN